MSFASRRVLGAPLVAITFSLGCDPTLAPDRNEPADAPLWVGDVDALGARCIECHDAGGERAALTTYKELAGCLEDGTPLATPASAETSPLLTALGSNAHTGLLDEAERARFATWIARGLPYARVYGGHVPGFAVAGLGAAAHGKVLRVTHFDGLFDSGRPDACLRCHTGDGGATDCSECHESSFRIRVHACTSCHGGDGHPLPRTRNCDSPEKRAAVGLHALHGPIAADEAYPSLGCATCHVVPQYMASPGHIRGDDTPTAEVRFDPEDLPTGRYDSAARSCLVTCHYDREVSWTKAATAATCLDCHADPAPALHHDARCDLCHKDAVDANQKPIGRWFHLNGRLEVGRECADCHPNGTFGAPDAHESHLSEGGLRSPIGCDICHRQPLEFTSSGHVDDALPAEVTLTSTLATGNGRLRATYEGGACAEVACHGADMDGGRVRVWTWQRTEVRCGDCHGIPPTSDQTGPHTARDDCWACHLTPDEEPTTDRDGITPAGRRVHANGCVNLEHGDCPPR
ncbi:MAG: hypothetical protein HYV07_08625 [Deltaproteobacteria bacterium]|nr:hypothetical protein [Deltaproteobacteria bacterium]